MPVWEPPDIDIVDFYMGDDFTEFMKMFKGDVTDAALRTEYLDLRMEKDCLAE